MKHAGGLALAALLLCGRLVAAEVGADPVQRGHDVFDKWCAPCHAPVTGGQHLPGTSTLESVYKGTKPAALEQRTDLTATIVALYVRQGINAMPPFRKTEISDADLGALGAYLSRNPAH